MSQQQILDAIFDERWKQDRQWGGPDHDDGHRVNDWVALITRHAGLAVEDGGDDDRSRFRRQMIRVAALAVAAIEAHDRTSERIAGKHATGSGF